MMKKMINHWRKHTFDFMKSTFRNWMMNADVQERKEQVKKEEGRIADTEFALENQTKALSAAKNKLNNELEEIAKL
jgi:hypothetical protein